MNSIAVFASGSGSNFCAIDDAIKNNELDATIEVLVVDQKNAKVIDKARNRGIRTLVLNPKDYTNKSEYETVIKNELSKYDIKLIVLAGYMRLIGSVLLHEYKGRIINIHPSLLPSFKGKDAVGQALKAGVKVTGVTVHFVDEGMDTGSVIDQRPLYIEESSREFIEENIHKIEHSLYKKVIKELLGGTYEKSID